MVAIVLSLLLAAQPKPPMSPRANTPTMPPELSCLARYYSVEPVQVNGAWSGRLADGTVLSFDDGRSKSFDEKLESPDLLDIFSIPYRTGPLVPVTEVNDDPGRIRVDELFRATYGSSREEVDVVPITFLGQKLLVHRKVVDVFARVESRLKEIIASDPSVEPFFRKLGGTFNWRKIANTQRQSAHSYGVSLDLNTELSHYWEWRPKGTPITWQNKVPQSIVDAFEAEGFIWGGRWYHYDTMHFEYRPELLDPACHEPKSASKERRKHSKPPAGD
jgi:hypothetical protein